jgi:hypothetical protein
MTITADQSKALRKAGLGHVCLFNGEFRNSKDFSALPADELTRVQDVLLTGSDTNRKEPTSKPAPVKKTEPPKRSHHKR